MSDSTSATVRQGFCGVCCTRIEKLSVTLGGSTILEDVNLHIHCGELLALIGPNGAGKTTLLKTMLGEVPHRGRIVFIPVGAEKGGTRAPRVGYVPQKLDVDQMSPTTVLDLFAAATSLRPVFLGTGRGTCERAAAALELVGAQSALLHRKVGNLSGGELQRVLLALALTPLPDILLLDEPVASVDRSGVELFHRVVSRLRTDFDLAVVLVSHDFPMASRFADRVVFLNKTVLLDGPPGEVLASTAVKEAFGYEPAISPKPEVVYVHHHHNHRWEGTEPPCETPHSANCGCGKDNCSGKAAAP